MSLWSRLFGRKQRASAPIDIVPDPSARFGPGIMAQASHTTLLAESIGIPATAATAIANRVATLFPEVKVERRTEDGTTEDEVLDDHPLAVLLANPHPNFSLSMILRLMAQYTVTVGEFYLIKVGNGFGRPTELHPVPPSMVQPLVERNIVQSYQVTDANGRQTNYPAKEMIRGWFPDPENPWRSEGYLGPNGIQADSHKFASQHLRAHYQKDATPTTVIETDETSAGYSPEDLKRFYTEWREFYARRGGIRSGLPAVLPKGFVAKQLAMMTGEGMTKLLEYWRDDLLMAHFTPRSVLGQVVSGDRSSAETNQWVFDRYAVAPVAALIESALTHQLAHDYDMALKVCFQEFVGEDKEHMLAQEKQDLELKVRSVNQVRADRGLDDVEWGEDPIGTSADTPYDPEAAAERANRPPILPGGGGPPGAKPAAEDDEMEERVAHIKLRQHYRARRRARKAA